MNAQTTDSKGENRSKFNCYAVGMANQKVRRNRAAVCHWLINMEGMIPSPLKLSTESFRLRGLKPVQALLEALPFGQKHREGVPGILIR